MKTVSHTVELKKIHAGDTRETLEDTETQKRRHWETLGDTKRDNGRHWETLGDNGRQWETLGDIGRQTGDIGRQTGDIGRLKIPLSLPMSLKVSRVSFYGRQWETMGDRRETLGDKRETLGDRKRDIGRHWETLGDIGRHWETWRHKKGDIGLHMGDRRETLGDKGEMKKRQRGHTGLMCQDKRKTRHLIGESHIFLKRKGNRIRKLKIGD
jgi:hypothetical protein